MAESINPTNAQTRTASQAPDKPVIKEDTRLKPSPIIKGTISSREAFSFHMHEHTSLRKEIEMRKQDLSKLQVYAVVGTFAVWSWLVASSKPLPGLIWYIPVIISVLGFMKSRTHQAAISRIAEYLRLLEDAIPKLPSLPGWENFIHEKRGRNWSSLNWNLFFWLILMAATIAVPFLFSGV